MKFVLGLHVMCSRLLFASYVVSCVFIVYTDKALAAQDLLDESLLQKRFNKNVKQLKVQ